MKAKKPPLDQKIQEEDGQNNGTYKNDTPQRLPPDHGASEQPRKYSYRDFAKAGYPGVHREIAAPNVKL